jgi:hypothetical protein
MVDVFYFYEVLNLLPGINMLTELMDSCNGCAVWRCTCEEAVAPAILRKEPPCKALCFRT